LKVTEPNSQAMMAPDALAEGTEVWHLRSAWTSA
jgi:hypothetical protein